MKPRAKPARKQPTPDDLVADLLDFLERKFYPGHHLAFVKDKPRLLDWVVLWPATWLEKRGVTIPPAEYRSLFFQIFFDGLAHTDLEKIKYLPAWLRMVIRSHFDHHGEAIYQQAKSVRALAEHTLLTLGKMVTPTTDPIREMAAARRLLHASKKAPARKLQKPSSQLSLL